MRTRRVGAGLGWLGVTVLGGLGVFRPLGGPVGGPSWVQGVWALYLVVGLAGLVTVVADRPLSGPTAAVGGLAGVLAVAAGARTVPAGLPVPGVVLSAVVAAALVVLGATRVERRRTVGTAALVIAAGSVLAAALLADGPVLEALVGLAVGPVTAGVLLGAPLASLAGVRWTDDDRGPTRDGDPRPT